MANQGYSADDIFGTSNSSSNQKETILITPPLEKEGDYLKIVDFVKGVVISGYKYMEKQSQMMIVFKELSTGHVHFHYMDDPDTKEYYQQFEGEEKAKKVMSFFKEITSYCRNYDYEDKLKAAVGEGKKTFAEFATKLLDHVISLNYQKEDVYLKLMFAAPSGEKEKFVSKRFCIGKDGWINFVTEGDYAELLKFELLTKTPTDFSTSTATTDIDSVFPPAAKNTPVESLL